MLTVIPTKERERKRVRETRPGSRVTDDETKYDARTGALLEVPNLPILARLASPNMLVMHAQASTGLVERYFIDKLVNAARACASHGLFARDTHAGDVATRPRSRHLFGQHRDEYRSGSGDHIAVG